MEKEQLLSDLTKKLRPIYLTTHDTQFFRPFIAWVVGELKKVGGDADLKMKESKYIAGVGPNGEIRWARYIPLVNVPTPLDGEKRNTNLVVCITFTAHGEEDGKIVPLMVEDHRGVTKPAVSNYSIGMLNKFSDPIELSSVFYKVTSVQQAKNVMAYLASRNNMYCFGEEITGTPEDRLQDVGKHMTILTAEGVKILKDKKGRNFITVKVPDEMVDTNALPNGHFLANHDPTIWDEELYLEVGRFLGLPKNSRYNDGRLRLEKVYTKNAGFTYFTYRLLPTTVDLLTPDELKGPKMVDPDIENIGLGDNSDIINEFRNIAKEWAKIQ